MLKIIALLTQLWRRKLRPKPDTVVLNVTISCQDCVPQIEKHITQVRREIERRRLEGFGLPV